MTDKQWAEDQRCKELDEKDAKADRLEEETARQNELWDARDGGE